jgi:hypothetical protein
MTPLDFDPDLDRLGDALRASAALDLTREQHVGRRGVTARAGGPAGVLVLAAAAAGVIVLTQRSSGEPAWAKQTLQRAAAVVIPPGSANTILHVTATETLSPLAQRAAATTVSTLSEQAWIQQGPPWGERAIVQVPGGPLLEESSIGEIYNQTSNTVYPAPQIPSGTPQYTLSPTGSGSYHLSVSLPQGGVSTETIDADTAEALDNGTSVVQWSVGWDSSTQTQIVGPVVVPSAQQAQQLQAQQPNPASTSFAAELRGLLDSGHARVTQTTTSNGQPAVEISSVNPQSGPQINYYVNPQTYAPIELDTFGYDSPNDVTTVDFTTYQTLPLAGNEQLLQVTIPSTAQNDDTPADYWNAAGLPKPF